MSFGVSPFSERSWSKEHWIQPQVAIRGIAVFGTLPLASFFSPACKTVDFPQLLQAFRSIVHNIFWQASIFKGRLSRHIWPAKWGLRRVSWANTTASKLIYCIDCWLWVWQGINKFFQKKMVHVWIVVEWIRLLYQNKTQVKKLNPGYKKSSTDSIFLITLTL